MKLNYTRKEVDYIKDQLFFTDEEEEILMYWLLDYSIVKIADILHLSTSTVSRRKNSIKEKLKRLP